MKTISITTDDKTARDVLHVTRPYLEEAEYHAISVQDVTEEWDGDLQAQADEIKAIVEDVASDGEPARPAFPTLDSLLNVNPGNTGPRYNFPAILYTKPQSAFWCGYYNEDESVLAVLTAAKKHGFKIAQYNADNYPIGPNGTDVMMDLPWRSGQGGVRCIAKIIRTRDRYGIEAVGRVFRAAKIEEYTDRTLQERDWMDLENKLFGVGA